MIEISPEANPNYLAKIVALKNLKKHSNADRLQTVDIDFQTVITGLDAKEGDIYVYFPVECKINAGFLAFTNSFRDATMNADSKKVGFFEDNCRVKAMKLRGEKSLGYIVPISVVETFIGHSGLIRYVGEQFDTIKNVKMLEKFVIPVKEGLSTKQGKVPKISRIIDGQIHLHVDTEQLRRNVHKLDPRDVISISYKTHGTSWWVSHALVKKSLTWYEKVLQYLGINIVDTEFDLVYGSRKVVKNKELKDPKAKDHFYGYDVWEDIKNQVGESIPKNYTLYGEALGYTKGGALIQEGYDYGLPVGSMKLEVYRITVTNPDGLVTELSTPEIIEFCERSGLTPSHLYFHGKADDYVSIMAVENVIEGVSRTEQWRTLLLNKLEKEFNEKDCFMCVNKVPEEGVVVRKETLFSFEAYKLKSFAFLQRETSELDKGVADLESVN